MSIAARSFADEEARKTLARLKEAKRSFASISGDVSQPDDVKRMLVERIPQWAELIKSAGIRTDER